MTFTPEEEQNLPNIIFTPRFTTYLLATDNNISTALKLYQWNLQISSALIIPLQVCEIAARNGIVLALEQKYGQNWHTSESFIKSLPQSKSGYSPYVDFKQTSDRLSRRKALTEGKVVADLKFAFWERMLTKRHDTRLWKPYFADAFPNADNTNLHLARGEISESLEKIRRLRNRIAHHEPIFTRDITEEYSRIISIIRYRCHVSSRWVEKIQTVTIINENKPIA